MQIAGTQYPLLQEILSLKGMALKWAYSTREVADIFEVSSRIIQELIAGGNLTIHDLPGRAKILPADLEAFIARTKKGN